jgi:hypothetical protein
MIVREHFGRAGVDIPAMHILVVVERHRPIARRLCLLSSAEGVFCDDALQEGHRSR